MTKHTTLKSGAAGKTLFAVSSMVLSTSLLLGTVAPLKAQGLTTMNTQTDANLNVTLLTGEIGMVPNAGATDDSVPHTGAMSTLSNNATSTNTGLFDWSASDPNFPTAPLLNLFPMNGASEGLGAPAAGVVLITPSTGGN